MFTEKEKILANWFFSDDRSNKTLVDADILDLNVFVDPDTTEDESFIGHIPVFVTGSQLLDEIEQLYQNRLKSDWGGKTTHIFYVPMVDTNNQYGADWHNQGFKVMGSIKMINQENVDVLANKAGLTKEYLIGYQNCMPYEIGSFDRTFCESHHLPIYLIDIDRPRPECIKQYADAAEVVEFFYELVTAVLRYRLPSTTSETFRNKPGFMSSKIVYNPTNPTTIPSVEDFSRLP